MANVSQYPNLFKSGVLSGLNLTNRLILAPMTRTSAEADGRPTERMRDYYRDFARGGFSLLISEGIYTDERFSQGYDYQPGLGQSSAAGGLATDCRVCSDGRGKVRGTANAWWCPNPRQPIRRGHGSSLCSSTKG